MRIFSRNEEAVSPVIGVILMVAITVILAAVIAAFVFGLGGTQSAAPTASIVAANNPDNQGADLKIQHKGGDILKGGEWKLSIVRAGNSPRYVTSLQTSELSVGSQIISFNVTDATEILDVSANVSNSNVSYVTNAGAVISPTAQITAGTALNSNQKYDVKLVHIPSNALLLDQVVEVR